MREKKRKKISLRLTGFIITNDTRQVALIWLADLPYFAIFFIISYPLTCMDYSILDCFE